MIADMVDRLSKAGLGFLFWREKANRYEHGLSPYLARQAARFASRRSSLVLAFGAGVSIPYRAHHSSWFARLHFSL